MGRHFLFQGCPDPGIEPMTPALAGRFFDIKSLGKPGGMLLASTHAEARDSAEHPRMHRTAAHTKIVQPKVPVVPGVGNSETELDRITQFRL